MSSTGSLVCVGVGMTLGSHITPLARSYIEKSDVVFTVMPDGVMELWLAKMHPDVRSLQRYYREGKSRLRSYGPAHEVTLYKAAALPASRPQIVRLPLEALPEAACDMHSTLVVPPASALEPDEEMRERLHALEGAVP